MPPAGSQPRLTAKTSISINPSQKVGSEAEAKAKALMA